MKTKKTNLNEFQERIEEILEKDGYPFSKEDRLLLKRVIVELEKFKEKDHIHERDYTSLVTNIVKILIELFNIETFFDDFGNLF